MSARNEAISIYDFNDKDRCINEFEDNMLNRTLTMFTYHGLPDSLPEDDLELIIQCKGYGIVTEHSGDLVALWGGFAPPYNVYYKPTRVLVVNPWADINKEYTIGKDCVLIKNDPLCRGLIPIMNKYGSFQTEVDITLRLALINLRAIYGITANTDDEYESAKEFLKDIEDGKQGVMMQEEMGDKISTQPFSNATNGYLTQIIEAEQYIKGSFFQEIGLQATFNMKRERLSEAESGMDEDCLRPLIDSMLEERKKAVEKINAMYGTNISVEFNSSWSKYNGDNTNSDSVTDKLDSEVGDEHSGDIDEVITEETTEENSEETRKTEETITVITEELADKVLDKLIEEIGKEGEEDESKEED